MRATVERFGTQIACLGSKSGPGFGSFELEIFKLSPLRSAAENEGEKGGKEEEEAEQGKGMGGYLHFSEGHQGRILTGC